MNKLAACSLCTIAIYALPAFAQEAGDSVEGTNTPTIGVGAMPGGVHVSSALAVPSGTFSALVWGGYGRRTGLIESNHKLNRGSGAVALSYSPLKGFLVGFSFDGRYDKHSGLTAMAAATPQDKLDAYVGDPRLFFRGTTMLSGVSFGGQLSLWFPGSNAPSIKFNATSAELRGLASLRAGPAFVSANVGFRYDRSAESALDARKFGAEDQVSLGVSEFNAMIGGLHAIVPLDKAWVAAELSGDLFLGSRHPSPTLRAGMSAGYYVASRVSLFAFAQTAMTGEITAEQVATKAVPLKPYETTFTVGAGVSMSFGGGSSGIASKPESPLTTTECKHPENPDPNDPADKDCPARVSKKASVSGKVLDDAGQPVVGAKVRVRVADKQGEATTDQSGEWNVADLPLGDCEISADVDGKKPNNGSMVLIEGKNVAPALTLETELPPGEIRGLVRAQSSGKPLTAKISIAATEKTPGQDTVCAADGTFGVQLPPGNYAVTVSIDGYQPQTLTVTITKDEVVIKNVDLRKK
jgi:hypothetical protein